MRLLTFLLLTFSLLSQTLAQDTPKPKKRMLHPTDSLQITLGEGGLKYLLHFIKEGQTLYSLADYYGVEVSDLYFHNPEFRQTAPTLGDLLKIPVDLASIYITKGEKPYHWRMIEVCYLIKPKETLFKIARNYFDMPIDSLRKFNNLKDDNLEIGELLVIGWIDIDGIAPRKSKYPGLSPAQISVNEKLRQKFQDQSYQRTLQTQKVLGVWNKNLTDTNLYALHRTAPVGTILRLTNPLNRRTLYVKVIGQMQSAGYRYDVNLVLSPAATRALGVLDRYFNLEIQFYE